MRRSFAKPGLAIIVTLGVLALAGASGSVASPGERSPSAPDGGFVGDGPGSQDQDNRKGRVEPTARQRALGAAVEAQARFNDLGTPGKLVSTGRPLAAGLPSDPVAAARAYIAGNRELLGLTPRAASSLEVVTVAPMGDGAAVLLQQRFGNLRGRTRRAPRRRRARRSGVLRQRITGSRRCAAAASATFQGGSGADRGPGRWRRPRARSKKSSWSRCRPQPERGPRTTC